jgi:hypothetical protein
MSAVFADGFQTGATLSVTLPLAILLIVCLWWLVSLRRGAGQ